MLVKDNSEPRHSRLDLESIPGILKLLMEKGGNVYILATQKHGTLYTGVTSDLIKRVYEHKIKAYQGFTAKYGVDLLVWFEPFPTIEEAITQEKKIKAWNRDWKISLIEKSNPEWLDLYENLIK